MKLYVTNQSIERGGDDSEMGVEMKKMVGAD
jgi:hypothetical protein